MDHIVAGSAVDLVRLAILGEDIDVSIFAVELIAAAFSEERVVSITA